MSHPKSAETPPPAGRRRWPRRVLWALAALLGVPVALVLLVLVLLSTEAGTRWALGTVADRLPGVEIGGVDGALLDAVTLRDLTVRDADGVWLSADRLAVDWAPWALLSSGRLVIESLAGQDVEVARPPVAAPDPAPDAATDGGGLDPRLLARLSLRGLDIDRLTLGPAILGTPAPVVLGAEGEATGRAGEGLSGAFSVQRLDAPGEAQVDFSYVPGGRLRLDATAFEPQGGALAALLDLPGRPPVRLSLNGEGPVEAWDGRLLAEAEDVATLEADLALRLTPDTPGLGTLAVHGTLAAGAQAPRPLAVLARPRVEVAATVVRAAEATRIEDLRLGADGWSLAGALGLGADGRLDGRIAARVAETAAHPETVVSALAGVPLGAAEAEVTLAGTLAAPRVEAVLDARDTVVETLSAQVEATLGETVTFAARGRLEGIAEEAPTLAPLAGAGLDLAVTGAAARDGSSVRLSHLVVTGDPGTVEGSADIVLDPLDVTADLEARVDTLSVLAPVVGLPVGGSARVSASLSTGAGGQARGPVRVVLEDFALGQPVADRLLAGTVELAGDLLLDDSGLRVADLSLTAPGASLAGRLELARWRDLDGAVTLAVPRLERLEMGLAGAASIDAALAGSLAAPRVTGTLRLPEGAVQGVSLADLAAAFTLTPEALALSDVQGRVAGAPAEGQATLSLASGLIDGDLRLALGGRDLPAYGVAFDGPARLSVVLALENGTQGLRAELEGEGLRVAAGDLHARGIEAEAVLADLFSPTPRGTYAVGLTAGGAAGIEWRRAAVEGALRDGEATATLAVSGPDAAPYEASAQASVALGAAPTRVRLADLAITGQGHRLALAAPTTLTLAEGGGVSLAETRLALDEATAVVALDLGPRQVALDLRAQGVPLDVFSLVNPDMPLTGHIDVTAQLGGPPTAPRGSFTVSSRDLTAPDAEVRGLTLDASGSIADGWLTARADVAGLGDAPGRVQASLPLVFSAQGVPSLPTDRPLEVAADWQGPVQAIWALIPQVGHRLAGQATVTARVEGTLDVPRFSGQGRLRGGTYENLEYGTVLRQLEATADLGADGSVRLSLSATDGGDGRLRGEGLLTTPEEGASQLTGSLTLQRATLVRRDDLRATLGGDLRYEGSLDQGTLSGTLRTYGAEVTLGGGLGGGGPAALNVVEVNREALPEEAGRPRAAEGEGEGGDAFGSEVALSISVDIPGQIFVRGQGLDSEWKGALTLRGTLADPRIVGQLSVVRGTYDVVGQTFVLERGVIDLRGGERVNPGLDVRAVHDTGDLRAVVSVTGTADRPEISLDSQPALPRDEILARVLFGRSLGDLGPAQAIGVARAASELAGGGGAVGGALDITSRLRKGLGLDVLSIGGGDSGPSVEAGKYISEDVYVGVEQGAGAGSGSVNVEVELTPRVSVKSKAGGAESDIGIEWKFDY